MIPNTLQNLADLIRRFPGIGPKQALRIALYLAGQPKSNLENLAVSIKDLKDNVTPCKQCFLPAHKQNLFCQICQDPMRDQGKICVVEKETDALNIDKAGKFKGVFHVVGTYNFEFPNEFKINNLLDRIQNLKNKKELQDLELILAFNSTTDGEATGMLVEQKLKSQNIKMSHLARGLSQGAEIEYADEITITNALENRK